MTASTLHSPVLTPHPHITRVAVGGAAEGDAPSLCGDIAALTCITPGTGLCVRSRVPCGGGASDRPPGGGGSILHPILPATGDPQLWVLLPVIDLAITPAVEAPGRCDILRT